MQEISRGLSQSEDASLREAIPPEKMRNTTTDPVGVAEVDLLEFITDIAQFSSYLHFLTRTAMKHASGQARRAEIYQPRATALGKDATMECASPERA